MQVYANTFRIEGADAYECCIRAIHGWVQGKISRKFGIGDITRDAEFSGSEDGRSAWLRSYACQENDPKYFAWVLKHTDDEVRGRQWVVEIGMRVGNDFVDFSCSVKSDEQSTLITSPVEASRPRLIGFLLRNLVGKDARMSAGAPGVSLKHIGADGNGYRALKQEIERSDRDFPLLIVSPDRQGVYHIHSSSLQDAVFGLAQVVEVDVGFDSYEMEEELGRRYSAWDGAVNLIKPVRQNGSINSVLLKTDEISRIGGAQRERISYLLALVTHETNISKLRDRIRPEGVARLSLKRKIEARKAAGEVLDEAGIREEAAMLWEEVERCGIELGQVKDERDAAFLRCMELEDKVGEAERLLRAERYKSQARFGRQDGEVVSVPGGDLFISLLCRSGSLSPIDCLNAISSAFPDRCSILPSALDSAEKVVDFQHGRRLLDMLRRLCTTFIDSMERGGDSLARQVFTNDEYSATESETVINSSELSAKRKFQYNGKDVEMFRHLKIGKADDTRTTIRVHFLWDSSIRKVVIGYCGEHLPISSY